MSVMKSTLIALYNHYTVCNNTQYTGKNEELEELFDYLDVVLVCTTHHQTCLTARAFDMGS